MYKFYIYIITEVYLFENNSVCNQYIYTDMNEAFDFMDKCEKKHSEKVQYTFHQKEINIKKEKVVESQ